MSIACQYKSLGCCFTLIHTVKSVHHSRQPIEGRVIQQPKRGHSSDLARETFPCHGSVPFAGRNQLRINTSVELKPLYCNSPRSVAGDCRAVRSPLSYVSRNTFHLVQLLMAFSYRSYIVDFRWAIPLVRRKKWQSRPRGQLTNASPISFSRQEFPYSPIPHLLSKTIRPLYLSSMDIKSLLNSSCNDAREHRSSDSPCLAPAQRHLAPIIVPKRQKIPKDAPVFSEGNKIVGHVNYPPYEAGNDRELEARHREFRIFPPGQIDKKGVRHIPYNSDKRDFLDKTGRDAFEGKSSFIPCERRAD